MTYFFIFRSVKASHILISASGRVCLSGFRDVCNMVQSGERLKNVYSYPTHPQKLLQWFSPEILEQVRKFHLLQTYLFLQLLIFSFC